MFNIPNPIKIDWGKIQEYIDRMKEEKAAAKAKIKCECGGDKAKTTHSDWCPKYEKVEKEK